MTETQGKHIFINYSIQWNLMMYHSVQCRSQGNKSGFVVYKTFGVIPTPKVLYTTKPDLLP